MSLGHRQADLDPEEKSSVSPIKDAASDRCLGAQPIPSSTFLFRKLVPEDPDYVEQIVLDGLACLGAAHHPQSNNLDTATTAGSRSLIDG